MSYSIVSSGRSAVLTSKAQVAAYKKAIEEAQRRQQIQQQIQQQRWLGELVVIEPDEGESESHDEGAYAAFEEAIKIKDYGASYL